MVLRTATTLHPKKNLSFQPTSQSISETADLSRNTTGDPPLYTCADPSVSVSLLYNGGNGISFSSSLPSLSSCASTMSFNLSGRGGLLPTGFDPISSITGGGIGDDGGNGGKGPRSDPLPITSSLTRSVPSSVSAQSSQASSTASPQNPPRVTQSVPETNTFSTKSSPTAGPGPVSISPTQSLGQGPSSASASSSAPASTPSVTVDGGLAPTASTQPTTSPQPQQTLAAVASIHRHALSRGAILGISLGILAVVITVVLLLLTIQLRRRRRDHRDTDLASRMVSPFVRLRSSTPVGGPEIPADSTGARQRYLEKEIRTTRTRMVEIERDSGTRVQPAENSSRDENVTVSSSNSPQATETYAEVAALRARIRELESQRQSAWALGLSDDPPPGYTA